MAIETQNQNRLDVQLEQVANQISDANPKTEASERYEQVVREQVLQQNLESMTLIALMGPEIMAKATMHVSYLNDKPEAKFETYALPSDVDRSLWDQGRPSDNAGNDSQQGVSQVWQEGLRLFRQMIDQRGYRLIWSPRFIRDEEQMLRRYGLVRASLRDRTADGSEHQIDHDFNKLMSLKFHMNDDAFSPRSNS